MKTSTSFTRCRHLAAALLLLALPACSDDDDGATDSGAVAPDAGAADRGAADQTASPQPDAAAADQRPADSGAPDASSADSSAADSATGPDAAASCDPEQLPTCIETLISQIEGEPVTNPPSSLTLYEYGGKCVYYLPPVCCDQYSQLYDDQCNVLCAPDGGLTGQGDGKCPDFFTNAVKIKLVWQDPRP